jgi:glycosyltransferase involved in cell wall biosynthesis
MRIAFVHDWEPDIYQELTWKDGLAAAIQILRANHELEFFTVGSTNFDLPHPYFPIHFRKAGSDFVTDVRSYNPDVILHWGDCTRPHASLLAELGKPMALCFAGGDPDGPTMQYFQHFFVESAVYKQRFELLGRSVSTAFGTNTKLFKPMEINKQFDVVFPATYAGWKRHILFTEAVSGFKSVCTGFMYDDHETECWQYPRDRGVLTLPHVSPETLRWLYAASGVCLITSHSGGGSQRTTLEAMAMNLPVICMEDSDKNSEYVREGGGSIVKPDAGIIHEEIKRVLALETYPNTRAYIMEKWSEFKYAQALEDGLKKILYGKE